MSSRPISSIKIALVHDYLREYGGAERVLETFHTMFPDAPVYTAFTDTQAMGPQWQRFQDWDIRTTWAAKLPFIKKLYSPLRILSAKFFESLDLSAFDVVISSTNMYMAKAIQVRPDAVHLCYCHTPPRSLYGYTTMTNWKKNPLIRMCGELINHFMRMVDFETAQRPSIFIANSKEVQARIQKFYRRDSVVVYPPIAIPVSKSESAKKKFVLTVGRLGFSKNIHLVVQACTKLNVPLKVVGTGKMLSYMQSLAGPTVEFLGSVDDATLRQLYAEASVLAYPAQDEDFGMIPVEAMAYGTPVVVHRSGGSKETVVEGKTGVFVDVLDEPHIRAAIQHALDHKWDSAKIAKHAQQFTESRFKQEIQSLLEKSLLTK